MNRRLFAIGLTGILAGLAVPDVEARASKGGKKRPTSGSRGGCGSKGGAGFRKANGKCADNNGR
jgi:hypothetical protein